MMGMSSIGVRNNWGWIFPSNVKLHITQENVNIAESAKQPLYGVTWYDNDISGGTQHLLTGQKVLSGLQSDFLLI